MAASPEPVLDLVALVEQEPRLAGVLTDALRLHDGAGFDPAMGFRPGEVHADGPLVRRLVLARVMGEAYQSRSTHQYRLEQPEVVREALALVREFERALSEPEPEAALPPDLFELVEGLEATRELLLSFLRAPRPVHALLVGDTGTGKSVLLEEIASLPGARYAVGSSTSRAGVLDYLLARPDVRYLVVDELDKMSAADLAGLLDLMWRGVVSRLQYRRQEQEARPVWVFAGCNRLDRFPPELRDRFHVEHLQPYTREQYEATVFAALTRREGDEPEFARQIAAWASERTRSVRAAVRLSRASRGSVELARDLALRMLG